VYGCYHLTSNLYPTVYQERNERRLRRMPDVVRRQHAVINNIYLADDDEERAESVARKASVFVGFHAGLLSAFLLRKPFRYSVAGLAYVGGGVAAVTAAILQLHIGGYMARSYRVQKFERVRESRRKQRESKS